MRGTHPSRFDRQSSCTRPARRPARGPQQQHQYQHRGQSPPLRRAGQEPSTQRESWTQRVKPRSSSRGFPLPVDPTNWNDTATPSARSSTAATKETVTQPTQHPLLDEPETDAGVLGRERARKGTRFWSFDAASVIVFLFVDERPQVSSIAFACSEHLPSRDPASPVGRVEPLLPVCFRIEPTFAAAALSASLEARISVERSLVEVL